MDSHINSHNFAINWVICLQKATSVAPVAGYVEEIVAELIPYKYPNIFAFHTMYTGYYFAGSMVDGKINDFVFGIDSVH